MPTHVAAGSLWEQNKWCTSLILGLVHSSASWLSWRDHWSHLSVVQTPSVSRSVTVRRHTPPEVDRGCLVLPGFREDGPSAGATGFPSAAVGHSSHPFCFYTSRRNQTLPITLTYSIHHDRQFYAYTEGQRERSTPVYVRFGSIFCPLNEHMKQNWLQRFCFEWSCSLCKCANKCIRMWDFCVRIQKVEDLFTFVIDCCCCRLCPNFCFCLAFFFLSFFLSFLPFFFFFFLLGGGGGEGAHAVMSGLNR